MRNGRKNVGGKRAMLAGTFMYRWLSGPDLGHHASGTNPPAQLRESTIFTDGN